ncbi:Conserved oligomeric Golgi complex subunit 2 [Heracleum sosnowskyi]|uniref:Conserved oligomeric Golgi complex subunit 2 n=1 Tax=Heracleum sosnowskyi TaxID=360622 RepID=A0AAD8HBY9_9APIA|nr:Conserved oligomeric Golgi complex subunit 2 [Heracleum sosnowskyi]
MPDLHPHSPHSRKPTDLFGDPIDSHPQWFKQSSFLDPNFDPESYISDLRTFVPFETLRSELRSHLASLKHELVELINRDYADFVNLSTKLVDVDASVVRMRAPLNELREKIVVFRAAVEDSLVKLRNGLQQRADAQAAREVLEVLLDTFHVVSKVEKLIKELPSLPADWSNGDVNSVEKGHLSNGIPLQHGESGMNLRDTQSMLLERIASEMNRLKFYMTHAQNLPFIQNMEKRIQSALLLLDASLGHCFIEGLEHRDDNAIYNCLRAYAAIDNTSNAEEIFRSTIVAPQVKKIIAHNLSELSAETSGDELEVDYMKINQFIEEDCKFLLEISSRENSGLHVFSFLANSILKEVLTEIQKVKPGAFSPGRPAEFLKNYKSSLEFLAKLEGYCPSRYAITKFRAEAVFVEFMKQWNIGVYFSLRFQEIAGTLDSALMLGSLVPVHNSNSDQGESHELALKQSVSLLACLRTCWSEDVLVITCSDKFLKLSLQLISRYSNWLSTGLAVRKVPNLGSNPGSEWAVSAAPDDLVYVIHDVNCLEEEISGNYLDHVLELLKSCSPEVLDLVKQSILQGGTSLKDLVPQVINSITETVVDKSVDVLKQIKGITATYRMTNKPAPVRHSVYVSGILRPLKDFLDGEKASRYLTKETRNELIHRATFDITSQYHGQATDLVTLARRTESSLQKIRLGAQRQQKQQKRGGLGSETLDSTISETDKVCMQLLLDIQEYGRNLSALGVEARNIPAYCDLWNCVATPERQNAITF